MKRLLLVDDSATMRQLLKVIILKHVACEITEAKDGLDALGKLKEGACDLVVTDVNMPRMDGLGFIRTVREVFKSEVPIVIVTTKGAEEDRKKGIELGANAYMTKPINGTQIVRTVLRILGPDSSEQPL